MKKTMIVDALAREQGHPLLLYLIKKLGSPEDAKDIVQESLFRLLKVKNIEQVENPKAYLYKIANNLIAEKYRSAPKVVIVSIDTHSAQTVSDLTANPERITVSREQLNKVAVAIEQLPERCKQAFILQRFHSMSYKEIASEMEISVKTVEKHIAKGLLHCHTFINEINQDNLSEYSSLNVERGGK